MFFIVLCFITDYGNKKSHNDLERDTKLQRKELFKLWIQKKGDCSNMKSEYIQNSVIGIYSYIFFCV